MIYFLRSGNLVKIGCSRSFESRMRDLRRDLPYPGDTELVAEARGHRPYEQHLHRLLHRDKAYGEWFYITDALIEIVKSVGSLPSKERRKAIRKYMDRASCPGWDPIIRAEAKRRQVEETSARLRAVQERKWLEREAYYERLARGEPSPSRLSRYS